MKFKSSRGIRIFLGIWVVFALFMNPVFAQSQEQPPGPSQLPKKDLPTITPPIGTLEKGLPSQPGLPTKTGVDKSTPSKAAIKAQVKPELIKINKRPPIQFKPFTYSEFKDPKTGQMLKPNQIVTLSHLKTPKQIRGDQFISEINRLEKDYNANGYSHRDRGEVVIGEFVIRKELLKAQADKIMSKTKKFAPSEVPQPLDTQTFERIHKGNMSQAQVRSKELKQAFQTLSSLPLTSKTYGPQKSVTKGIKAEVAPPSVKPLEFKPVHQEKHWNEEYGDPDLFAVHQKIDIILDGQKEKLTLMANNELGITIFNQPLPIVEGIANLSAPGPDAKDSNVQGYFIVKCLGNVKLQVTAAPTSNQPYSGYVPILDVPPGINIDIPTPTPISVSVSYSGSIGINYNFSVTPLAINCQIYPTVEMREKFVMSFGIGVFGINIAELSYEGGILFIKDKPVLLGEITVGELTQAIKPAVAPSPTVGKAQPSPTPQKLFVFKLVTKCFDNFTGLRGKAYICFKIDLIFWEKKWKFLLFENVGFEHYDFLFDEELTQPLLI